MPNRLKACFIWIPYFLFGYQVKKCWYPQWNAGKILISNPVVFQVIDFGCSEGKLISQLKRVDCVEELVGIDIDYETLEFNKRRTRPFSADYLDPRSKPLTVSLFQGKVQTVHACSLGAWWYKNQSVIPMCATVQLH